MHPVHINRRRILVFGAFTLGAALCATTVPFVWTLVVAFSAWIKNAPVPVSPPPTQTVLRAALFGLAVGAFWQAPLAALALWSRPIRYTLPVALLPPFLIALTCSGVFQIFVSSATVHPSPMVLAIAPVALILLSVLFTVIAHEAIPEVALPPGVCPICGYNLTGSPGPRCPECAAPMH